MTDDGHTWAGGTDDDIVAWYLSRMGLSLLSLYGYWSDDADDHNRINDNDSDYNDDNVYCDGCVLRPPNVRYMFFCACSAGTQIEPIEWMMERVGREGAAQAKIEFVAIRRDKHEQTEAGE